MGSPPLEGIRVLDFTRVVAGPLATRLLAQMGAEVIKVEGLTRYDSMRSVKSPSAYPKSTPGGHPYNSTAGFNVFNVNKLSIVLELTNPAAVDIVRRLVAISDIVVDNYSPRVMKNFGLGYESLRTIQPDIIALTMPGFGTTGPEKDYVSYARTLEMVTGMASLSGYDPQGPPYRPTGIAVPDVLGGLYGAAAVLVAIHRRRQTGHGQFIDLGQIESTGNVLGDVIMDYVMNKRIRPRRANRHDFMAPHNVYPCKGRDKWIAIAVRSDKEWNALCKVMADPEWSKDERFSRALSRWKYQEELDQHLAEWTIDKDATKIMEVLQNSGISAGAALSASDLYTNPHLRARGDFQTLSHPEAGTYDYPLGPIRIGAEALKLKRPAPVFGQHNNYVFKALLGMTDALVQQLEKLGVTGAVPR